MAPSTCYLELCVLPDVCYFSGAECLDRHVCSSLGLLMFGIFKPYKNNFFNILDATMFTLLELNQIWAVYETYAFKVPPILNILLAPVPFVYLCAIIIYKIVSLCVPSTLAKWKTKLYFLSALQTISGQRESLNILLNPAQVNVEDVMISPPTSQIAAESRKLSTIGTIRRFTWQQCHYFLS